MTTTLAAIQQLVGGEITGDGAVRITGVNSLDQAQPSELAFVEDERYRAQAEQSNASALVVPLRFAAIPRKHLLRVDNPRAAIVKVIGLFHRAPAIPSGIHPTATIDPDARLEADVTVGEHVVIRSGARVGRGTILDSGVHVGSGVTVGEACRIGPQVVLMDGVRLGHRVIIQAGSVIGGDGFGYVWSEGRHVKIPQVGSVIIEDDVELGVNVCVDRAMFGSTIIRRGTKVDNLVQIAHSDVVGEDVIIAGQVGLAGSVTVGNRVMIGGQSGVVDHVTIGDDVRIGAATIVTRHVKAGETMWGFPAKPSHDAKREIASLAYLPRLLLDFRKLLARFTRMESRLDTVKQAQRRTRRKSPA